MRARTLEEFAGQTHILGPGKLLRRMITADRLTSLLFYGPPGTGKTTLAHLIATHTKCNFIELNATASNVKELRDALSAAKKTLEDNGTRTVLFLDEIHRFNKAQQDALLADVEAGLIILIGATTENPFFAVNAPLVSRSQIFQFQPLSEEDIRQLIWRAAKDPDRGFGKLNLDLREEAVNHWVTTCDGDARRALTALEIAVLSGGAEAEAKPEAGSQKPEGDEGPAAEPLGSVGGNSIVIDMQVAQESIQRKAVVYDGTGDQHYDAASAFIKSMRGSDPDAAIYWLAYMLHAGEDPRFIARRICILASEDIGNADPGAIMVANAAAQITQFIGLPECALTLAQAVIYMACVPKSNASNNAISAAMEDVEQGRTIPVPKHLRDAHYAGAKGLGHEGYVYPHDHPEGYVAQDYLGVEKCYYTPTNRGREAQFRAYLDKLRQGAGMPASADPPKPSE